MVATAKYRPISVEGRQRLYQQISAKPDGPSKDRAIAQMLQLYGPAPIEKKSRLTLEAFEPYRYKPEEYLKQFLKWEPWSGLDDDHPGQLEVLRAIVLSIRKQLEKREYENGNLKRKQLQFYVPGETIQNWFRVESGNGIGKCLCYNELMLLGDGRRVPAETLVGQVFDVSTLSSDGRVITTQATAFDNGIQPVYEITTETGKRLIRTGNHPLWHTEPRFRPSRQPLIDHGRWIPIQDISVGDLIAVPEYLTVFGNKPMPIDEVKAIAYLIGDGGISRNTIRFSQQESPQLTEYLEVAKRLGCRVVKLNKYDYIAYGEGNVKGTRNGNPLTTLMRQHGLMGKTARQKSIPPGIFQLPQEHLRVFLSRLFSTDGWASSAKNGCREIGFCSASERLLRDVAHLLLRFGVHCRVRYRPKVDAWTLSITHSNDQIKFIDEIGIFGKEEATARIAAVARPHVERRSKSHDARPERPRWIYKNAYPGTRWEKVSQVRYVGEERTVGIEVPEHHTYLSDVYEHNTKMLSGFVNWFIDCFNSIIYTFHTTAKQDELTTWKEIRTDRRNKGLPGRILGTKLDIADDRFAESRSTSDSHGQGETKIKGQHNEFLGFLIDEADGVLDFVFDAIETMESGGISIVLMTANPRTRSSRFHRIKKHSYVRTFRISSLYHPNVVQAKDVIPGAVRRDFIEKQIEKFCSVVDEHNDEKFTFELPYDVVISGILQPAGTIFEPLPEFMWTVLGIAPPTSLDKTVISVGTYEAACKRVPQGGDPTLAYVGVDCARSGKDSGTVYIHWQDAVWRSCELYHQETQDYVDAIRTECLKLKEKGVTELHIRVDAGYGSGVIDALNGDSDLKEAFAVYKVFEVHFNARAYNHKDYYNVATEMYYEAAETLKEIAIYQPPDSLEIDLTEREYRWINQQGKTKKILEPKEDFTKRNGRSPDDGDGLVLAIAPEYCFQQVTVEIVSPNVANTPRINHTPMVDALAKRLGKVSSSGERIAIIGWPRSGKTTLAKKMGLGLSTESVRSTDDVKDLGWSEASEEVATWFDKPGPWIIEGVAVARALRKWKAAHPNKPAPIDKLIRIGTPKMTLTTDQTVMGKGIDRVLEEILPWLRKTVTIETVE